MSFPVRALESTSDLKPSNSFLICESNILRVFDDVNVASGDEVVLDGSFSGVLELWNGSFFKEVLTEQTESCVQFGVLLGFGKRADEPSPSDGGLDKKLDSVTNDVSLPIDNL